MAHNTLKGGTSYSVIGGNIQVNSTTYPAAAGKTLIDNTSEKIKFLPDDIAVTPSQLSWKVEDSEYTYISGTDLILKNVTIEKIVGAYQGQPLIQTININDSAAVLKTPIDFTHYKSLRCRVTLDPSSSGDSSKPQLRFGYNSNGSLTTMTEYDTCTVSPSYAELDITNVTGEKYIVIQYQEYGSVNWTAEYTATVTHIWLRT